LGELSKYPTSIIDNPNDVDAVTASETLQYLEERNPFASIAKAMIAEYHRLMKCTGEAMESMVRIDPSFVDTGNYQYLAEFLQNIRLTAGDLHRLLWGEDPKSDISANTILKQVLRMHHLELKIRPHPSDTESDWSKLQDEYSYHSLQKQLVESLKDILVDDACKN
jgi:hypothetical protein